MNGTGKKKILIINNNMHIGGVQKALVNLLKELARDTNIGITLLLFYRGGELLQEIPERIEIVEAGSAFRYMGMTSKDVTTVKDAFFRGALAAFTRLFGRDKMFNTFFNYGEKMKGYDVAISFLHSGKLNSFYGGCNEYLFNCVEAKRKVTFLHCDYESIGADCSYNTSLYEKADLIAVCSDGCRKAFLRVLPQFENKTAVVPNCHDYEMIRKLAEEDARTLPDDRLNILTVARMGKEKGVSRAIRAIGDQGLPADVLRYYIVGNGIEYEVKGLIKELDLRSKVTLLGEMTNPYGYMKAADVLLIPSVSEAAPLVIDEAAFLGTPVLSTATVSADEMIKNRGIGWVCDNSVQGIEDSVKSLVDNHVSIEKVRENLRKMVFDNKKALERFYRLVLE